MNPVRGADLQSLNTLAVPSTAAYFCRAESVADVSSALDWAERQGQTVHVLGGGSNVVLPESVDGLVLSPALTGKAIVFESDSSVEVRFGAGEDWHAVVEWSLQQGLYGLENLALIPGTVGAAPVQNIGAYGVELRDCFERLDALDRRTHESRTFNLDECEFGYRDSVFKNALRDRYIITSVTLRLSRQPQPKVEYPALRQALGRSDDIHPEDVFAAVCRIRAAKLPDPKLLPNCGSFFKNPIVTAARLHALIARHPQLVAFETSEADQKKIAAGWLIEDAGWKGRELQGARVHAQQSLVLTNPKRASAEYVLALAAAVQRDIVEKFGVELEMEPQLLGWR